MRDEQGQFHIGKVTLFKVHNKQNKPHVSKVKLF